jgi:hypothetical protein
MLKQKQTAHRKRDALTSLKYFIRTPDSKLDPDSATPQMIPFMNLFPGTAAILYIVIQEIIATHVKVIFSIINPK